MRRNGHAQYELVKWRWFLGLLKALETFYSAAAATASVTYCMHESPAHPQTFRQTAWLTCVHLFWGERKDNHFCVRHYTVSDGMMQKWSKWI